MAHVVDELNLLRPMLVGMTVGPVGSVFQRGKCPVIPLSPAVNILPVCVVAYSGLCDSVFLRVVPIPGCLCYLIHSKGGHLPFGFVSAAQP